MPPTLADAQKGGGGSGGGSGGGAAAGGGGGGAAAGGGGFAAGARGGGGAAMAPQEGAMAALGSLILARSAERSFNRRNRLTGFEQNTRA